MYQVADCRVVQKKQLECKDPSDEFLDNILTGFTNMYNSFEQQTLATKGTKTIGSENVQTDVEIFDESQCLISSRNTTLENQRSICPWKYLSVYREDKYPRFRRFAKCTCNSCYLFNNSILPKGQYKCMPLYESFTALKRTVCDLDGFYKWEPFVEQVPVGCFCGLAFQFQPI